MSIVSVIKCEEYERQSVYDAVKECLRLIASTDGMARPGMKVLLKPNLLSPSQGPEKAINTHPVVIRALVDIFQKDYGCEVLLGDSCGSVRNASTFNAFRVTGIDDIARETGMKTVNFDKDERIELVNKNGKVLKSFDVAKTVKDVDMVVSLPKLKTHGLTLYTGAIKNMFGAIPANGKKNVHLLAPQSKLMAQALVDVYEVTRPHISIMDGIIGMEGNGPNAGEPRKVGVMLASVDGVALDAVASSIIGFNPMDVPIIRYAHERGLGTADMADISVLGETIENVSVPDFKKPSSSSQDFASKYVPNFLLSGMFRHSCTTFSTIYQPNCTQCYECIVNCPAKAMSAPDGKVIVDKEKCIGCFCCDEVCNFKAIKMKRSFIGETLLTMARFLGVESVE